MTAPLQRLQLLGLIEAACRAGAGLMRACALIGLSVRTVERWRMQPLQIELEAEKKLDERLKSYWANVVTLFGAFIGVFSLIVGFLKIVPLEANSTFWSVFILSSAQVLPLALMLGAFVWLLRALFK